MKGKQSCIVFQYVLWKNQYKYVANIPNHTLEVIGVGTVMGENTFEFECDLEYNSYETGIEPVVSWTSDNQFISEVGIYQL